MGGLQSKTTVVPIDFSDLSMDALDRALEITDGQLHVLHVLPVLSAVEPGMMYGTDTDEGRIEKTNKYLEESLKDEKFSSAIRHAVIGDPGHEISKYAQEVGADLIVIPSHGYGFVKHLLLGSVAERVVRLAHCPVLVLRK